MKSTEFIIEGTEYAVQLTPASRGELETIIGWGIDAGSENSRARYLASKRLLNRFKKDALSTSNVRDFKKLRGLAVASMGFETMHIDRAIQGIEQRFNEDGIDKAIDDDMTDPIRRQARLKAEIEAGMMPTIHNVSSSPSPIYTMGDVEALGWMEKEYTHDMDGEVDGWIRYYDGPKPIRVHTRGAKELQTLKPGGVLD